VNKKETFFSNEKVCSFHLKLVSDPQVKYHLSNRSNIYESIRLGALL